jgi:RimJ/RimL family protein N-acetyltransferase
MLLIDPARAAPLMRKWLDPAEPRLLSAWHVALTGNGACLVDTWPAPRCALLVTGSNHALLGQPSAITADELRAHVKGSLEAPEAFTPLVRDAIEWPRVNLVQSASPWSSPAVTQPTAEVRLLEPADAHHLWALTPDLHWIFTTWGGPPGLAASGMAYGAFVDGQLASVACTFFVAERFEDIGVVTESGYRGRALSPACAAALCTDIRGRGRIPTWSTSPDNTASLRVAEKLGFSLHHLDRLWVVGRKPPEPAALT